MLINLKELKQGRTLLKMTVPCGDLDLGGMDVRVVGDVKAGAEITKSRDNVEVKLDLRYDLEAPCSRCLEPSVKSFHERGKYFFKMGKEESVEAHELEKEEDMITQFVSEESVDLAQSVRELVILSIPMKWLCSEDCKGLCPVCGQNLNEGDCGHSQEPVDPRWNTLREIGEEE